MQFEKKDFRFNNMETPSHGSWDTAHVISNSQNVGQHLSTSNTRSTDTGETKKFARSNPPLRLHYLGSNHQSETMSTAFDIMATSEDSSGLSLPLLRDPIWNDSSHTGFMPPATAGYSRCNTMYLEPNAPITHTRAHDQEVESEDLVSGAWLGGQTHGGAARPKRSRIALVQEEEMNNFREDRAGTPHISELLVEDDMVEIFSVEELGMEHAFHAVAEVMHQNEAMLSSSLRYQGTSRGL